DLAYEHDRAAEDRFMADGEDVKRFRRHIQECYYCWFTRRSAADSLDVFPQDRSGPRAIYLTAPGQTPAMRVIGKMLASMLSIRTPMGTKKNRSRNRPRTQYRCGDRCLYGFGSLHLDCVS